MKNKIGIVLAVLLGFSALGLGVFQTSASEAEPKLSFDEIKQLVKDQYPGEITELELEKDRNKAVYEVEISNDEKEYDIKLDGNTGEILKLEEQLITGKEQSNEDTDDNKAEASTNDKADDSAHKKENDTKKKNDKKNDDNIKEKDDSADKKDSRDNNNGKKTSERTAISPSKAKQIAKEAFNGSIVSIELDQDDGKRIYEVELKTKNKEAEIEIDAYTGEVIVLSIDTDDAKEDQDDKDDEADDNVKDEDDDADGDDEAEKDDDEDNEDD